MVMVFSCVITMLLVAVGGAAQLCDHHAVGCRCCRWCCFSFMWLLSPSYWLLVGCSSLLFSPCGWLQVLPVVVFFSCVITMLYHMGVMQCIISKIAFVMRCTLGTTAAESLCAAGNIFVGQVSCLSLVLVKWSGNTTVTAAFPWYWLVGQVTQLSQLPFPGANQLG